MMHKMYKNILYEISLKKRYSFGFCSYIKNKKQFKLTEKVVVSSLSLMWCLYPYGAAHLSHGSNNLRLIWRFYCKSGLQQRSKDQFLFVFIQFCMIVFIFVVFILLVKGFWDDEAQQMRKQKMCDQIHYLKNSAASFLLPLSSFHVIVLSLFMFQKVKLVCDIFKGENQK